MQAKTFNRLVVANMTLAIILPLSVWFLDNLSGQTGMFPNMLGALALMAMPIFWLLGNVVSGFFAYINRPLINRLFLAQCIISGIILLAFFVWQTQKKLQKHQQNLRHQVVQAIITGNINAYKQALKQCGNACINQAGLQSATNNQQPYDEYAYKNWLVTAVAAQAGDIVDDLLTDPNRPNMPLVGSGAPYLTLNDSCNGYFVGEADVYQIAVLQKTSAMLLRLIATANVDDKSTALWYAAQANRIEYVQLILAAGAERNIKDAYGVNGVEKAGYSLLDAALSGFAVDTLQWLLNNGFAPNGQLGIAPNGQNETPNLKHTPLHTVIYMARQELQQFNSLERSLQMWQILKKAGADDTIAEPHSDGTTQTPLQFLLQANVYEDSAKIVQALMAENIATVGLTAAQKIKLNQFLNTKVDNQGDKNRQTKDEYCAENVLRKNYHLAY